MGGTIGITEAAASLSFDFSTFNSAWVEVGIDGLSVGGGTMEPAGTSIGILCKYP